MPVNFTEGCFSPHMMEINSRDEALLGIYWVQLLSVEHEFSTTENELYNLLTFSLGSSAYSSPPWYTVGKGQLHMRPVRWAYLSGTELSQERGGPANPELHLPLKAKRACWVPFLSPFHHCQSQVLGFHGAWGSIWGGNLPHHIFIYLHLDLYISRIGDW